MTKKKKVKKKAMVKKTTQSTGQKPKKTSIRPIDVTSETSSKKAAQKKTPPEVVPMPTAGRKVTEFEDKLDAALFSADYQLKRGRGRPRKEAEQQPPEIDVKVIGQAIQIPFDLWSIQQDVPVLKISFAESIMIAKPLKQILDHYMPDVPDITWAWISLSAVSYSIMKSRLVLIAEIKKARTSSLDEQTAGENGVPERRGQGRPQSAAFPSFEEITKPVT